MEMSFFLSNPSALWCLVLKACHGEYVGLGGSRCGRVRRGVWRGIIGSINSHHDKEIINQSTLSRVVGNGANKRF